jgi:hypothetical protein
VIDIRRADSRTLTLGFRADSTEALLVYKTASEAVQEELRRLGGAGVALDPVKPIESDDPY